jgi:membrane-associated phospholipid phosphatase
MKARKAKETALQYLARFSTMNGRGLYVLLAAAVAFAILARFNESFPGDVSLIRWVRTRQYPVITAFMKAVSVIGKSWLLIGMAGATALGLFVAQRRRGERSSEYLAAVGTLVIMVICPILQIPIDRSRPPADLVGLNDQIGGLSFPSGHAYQSFVLFSFLIYLAAILISRTWLRRSVQALLAFLILSIGVSRVYLGAHWPSDVLGAYLLGGSFLALLLRGQQTKTLFNELARGPMTVEPPACDPGAKERLRAPE